MTEKSNQKTTSKLEENYELRTLVMAKRMGMSFEELSFLTMQDFLDFVDAWIGKEETVRNATQADIDRFMG